MTEQLKQLRAPFPANQISYLPKGGVKLAYVGHAALTDRLLDVDPAWSWEPLALDERGLPALDEVGGLWIRLTVCGVTRLGYGDAGQKKGGDAMKERIGDALRNAAMRFGAALDLWHKGELHAHEEAAPTKTARPDVSHSGPAIAFSELSPDWQAWVKDTARDVENTFDQSGADAAKRLIDDTVEREDLDPTIQAAIWSQLPSKTRSAIKAVKPEPVAA